VFARRSSNGAGGSCQELEDFIEAPARTGRLRSPHKKQVWATLGSADVLGIDEVKAEPRFNASRTA